MYTSTPASEVAVDDGLSYEPAFTDVLHGEIKRRSTVEVSKSNRTDDRSLPLFEMYQFLSPGNVYSPPPQTGRILTVRRYIHGPRGQHCLAFHTWRGLERYIELESILWSF